MRNRFLSMLFLTFMFSLNGISQEKHEKEIKKFKLNPWENVNGFRVAPSYLKNFELEVSYLMSSYPQKDPGFGGFSMLVQNIGIGLEYVNINQQNAVGTKLTYEVGFSVFSAQMGVDFLASDKDLQFRLMPRLGLSLFSFVNLYYGWNHHFIQNSLLKTPNQTISLQINVLDIFY